MKKYSKALVNLAVAVVTVLAVILLLPKIFVFFAPFVAGWVIALIAGPLVRFFEEKVKIKRKVGGAFVIVVVIGLVVFLLYLIGAKLIDQLIGLIGSLPEMWRGMEADFNNIGRNMGVLLEKLPSDIQDGLLDFAGTIGSYLGDFFGRIGTPTITAAGNFAKQLPAIFIGVIMALLSAYFFVAEREQINEWFRAHMPAGVQLRYRMMRESIAKSVGGYFRAQFKIEIWMYFLLVIGFAILGVNYSALIALGIACLDFLPFFGTGTVLIPWAIIKILTMDYKVAIGLLIMWGGGQLARQIIQPKIVGDSMGVPPIPTLFLLYIGYKAGSVIGMIIAVPLGILLYTMYQQGAFDTTKNSILILVAGLNKFRRLGKDDLFEVDEMMQQNKEAAKAVEQQREQEILARQAKEKEKKEKKKIKNKK